MKAMQNHINNLTIETTSNSTLMHPVHLSCTETLWYKKTFIQQDSHALLQQSSVKWNNTLKQKLLQEDPHANTTALMHTCFCNKHFYACVECLIESKIQSHESYISNLMFEGCNLSDA